MTMWLYDDDAADDDDPGVIKKLTTMAPFQNLIIQWKTIIQNLAIATPFQNHNI